MGKVLIGGTGCKKPKREREGRKGVRDKGKGSSPSCCWWDQDKCFQSCIFHMTPSKSSRFDD